MQSNFAMNSGWLHASRLLPVAGLMAIAGLDLGCRSHTEPSAGGLTVAVATTPSVDAVRAADVEVRVSHRPFATTPVPARGGSVVHSPLYWADPFEEPNEDGCVAWSTMDSIYFVYGPVRFLVSTALFPIGFVDTPPWQEMVSDGRVTFSCAEEPPEVEGGG